MQYLNVKTDPRQLEAMLVLSQGERTVPVIDEGGKVAVGWHGKG